MGTGLLVTTINKCMEWELDWLSLLWYRNVKSGHTYAHLSINGGVQLKQCAGVRAMSFLLAGHLGCQGRGGAERVSVVDMADGDSKNRK